MARFALLEKRNFLKYYGINRYSITGSVHKYSLYIKVIYSHGLGAYRLQHDVRFEETFDY